MEPPSKVFAAVLGLTAFAVAILTGLAVGVEPAVILRRAMIAMVLCYLVGSFLGFVAGHAIREYLASYRARFVPPSMDEAAAMYGVIEEPET